MNDWCIPLYLKSICYDDIFIFYLKWFFMCQSNRIVGKVHVLCTAFLIWIFSTIARQEWSLSTEPSVSSEPSISQACFPYSSFSKLVVVTYIWSLKRTKEFKCLYLKQLKQDGVIILEICYCGEMAFAVYYMQRLDAQIEWTFGYIC